DKGPLDVLTEQDVWKDYNLGQLYVNQIYASLPGGILRNFDGATEIEDANLEEQRTYAVGEVTPNNSPFSEAWTEDYQAIARINKFLANFNPENADPAKVEILKAEALFLRA